MNWTTCAMQARSLAGGCGCRCRGAKGLRRRTAARSGWRRLGRQFPLLVRRQALVLLPLLSYLVLLLGRKCLERLVPFARGVALVRRQAGPLLHLALDALLLIGSERRVALGEPHPFLL